MFKRLWFIMIALLLTMSVVSAQQQGFTSAEPYVIEVINTYPHDTSAFTQGLLWYDGHLYESTGQRGESTLREVDLTSGEVQRSIPITRGADSDQEEYFAEGLARVDDRLIQLTWTAGEAFVYDLTTFERLQTIPYEGQGWGVCYDERFLYVSDSTQYLAVRDAESFDLIARMLVTLNGQPIQASLLNELECVGDYVYANLWTTDFIAQIDKTNGNIVGLIDATGLLTPEMVQQIPGHQLAEDGTPIPPSNAVLNGIAYNPESETFYITGKDWPTLFEVQFVAASPESQQ